MLGQTVFICVLATTNACFFKWPPWGEALDALPKLPELPIEIPLQFPAGLQPGGAGRPRPSLSNAIPGLQLPLDIIDGNGGVKPNCLLMSIGRTDKSDVFGDFCVFLFEDNSPGAATDMRDMAIGNQSLRTSDPELANHEGGFEGLDLYTVFPQFVTCRLNISVEAIWNYIRNEAEGTIQGDIDMSDRQLDLVPFFLMHPGSGMVVVAQMSEHDIGNFYYIATTFVELAGIYKYRVIGFVSPLDMLFINALRLYTCLDYENVVMNVISGLGGRRKRTTSSVGFTACSVK